MVLSFSAKPTYSRQFGHCVNTKAVSSQNFAWLASLLLLNDLYSLQTVNIILPDNDHCVWIEKLHLTKEKRNKSLKKVDTLNV